VRRLTESITDTEMINIHAIVGLSIYELHTSLFGAACYLLLLATLFCKSGSSALLEIQRFHYSCVIYLLLIFEKFKHGQQAIIDLHASAVPLSFLVISLVPSLIA
jgi:hypothetical protein